MRRLNYVLLSALVYCMVNPLMVWTQTSTILTICAGESVFLPAEQTFPTPAQPPQGPDGSIPITPCTPQLNDVSILPLSNSTEVGLTGFMVSPTETTIYTVTSNGVCGGPGSAGFGSETLTYEVVVDNSCGAQSIDATIVTCLGQSVFLDAIQTFPIPPLGPQGSPMPCRPQLIDINIVPLNNVTPSNLAGFVVNPTETTVYTVTSNGICGGPGSAGFGEQTITYEVVVDNSCGMPSIDATIVTCLGESVFLEAIQAFPIPPLGPQGSVRPCTPLLSDISIVPLDNATTTSLAGFTVNPTETTIYTVTSNGVCGGPGSGNFGVDGITYEVVVDNNCGAPPINETLVICQGESIFLDAVQSFPQPPQGPQGSVTPCTPLLSNIGIMPMMNSVASGLTGFMVSPTETTIYTVTSNGVCGGPGSGNFGMDGITYEVVVDNTCGSTASNSVINDFPWLTGIFDPNACNGASVVVYQQGAFRYLLVNDGVAAEQLYYEDGTFYCQGSPSYDCVAAYGFTSIVDRWDCGDMAATCGGTYGTFFFDDCNGQTFYFIELEDGRIFDPYFADGISFNPQEGQSVFFDYAPANFATPCSIADAAIIMTCLTIAPTAPEVAIDGETIAAIFPQFSSWMPSLIDANNCQGETVTVYRLGGYDYVLIKNANGVERLYLEDGTFYCESTATYNCMVAYGFNQMIASWACNAAAPTAPDTPNALFTDYPWLNDVASTDGCAIERVEVYASGGYNFLSVTTNGTAALYFQDGTFYCQDNIGYSCTLAYGFGAPITTWVCEASFAELPATNLVVRKTISSLPVYPNPTNGLLNVPIAFSDKDQSLRLIDLFGKTIATRSIAASESGNKLTFDLTPYPAGIYYVEWLSGTERIVQKVVRR